MSLRDKNPNTIAQILVALDGLVPVGEFAACREDEAAPAVLTEARPIGVALY